MDNTPVGCGAIRKIDADTAEIKRVYARKGRIGIGKAIVEFLEKKASSMGYKTAVLETRKINNAAVSFYSKLGYNVVPNYGKYKDSDESICISKTLL